jgi:Flp pilus assembly protein TadB
MEDDADRQGLEERLDRIETQTRQTRLLLVLLLVIVVVGLPGMVSTIFYVGKATLLMLAAVSVICVGLYLLDWVLLRRLRAKREKQMEREILDRFHSSRAADGTCEGPAGPVPRPADREPGATQPRAET